MVPAVRRAMTFCPLTRQTAGARNWGKLIGPAPGARGEDPGSRAEAKEKR